MNRYQLLLLTNPVEGREDEFNAWYDGHVDHMLEIPGVVSGRRFRQTELQRSPDPQPWKYMAIYELETDDLSAVMAEIGQRAGTPALPGSSSMAPARIACFYEPITDLKRSRD